MSDERKPLEMTEVQARELRLAMSDCMPVEVFELVSGWVLEEAVKALASEMAMHEAECGRSGSICDEDQRWLWGYSEALDLVRAMKGKP